MIYIYFLSFYIIFFKLLYRKWRKIITLGCSKNSSVDFNCWGHWNKMITALPSVCQHQRCSVLSRRAVTLFHQVVALCLGSHCSSPKAGWLSLPARSSGHGSAPLEAFCDRVSLAAWMHRVTPWRSPHYILLWLLFSFLFLITDTWLFYVIFVPLHVTTVASFFLSW